MYQAGNFICGASVTGNADESGDALFGVWIHGWKSSQLLGSEIAEQTEMAPVVVLFDRDHRLGLRLPPYRLKAEAAGAWKVLREQEGCWG